MNKLHQYQGTLLCHATTGINLKTILQMGHISPNALPKDLFNNINRRGVGITKVLPSLNFSPNYFQEQYSFSDYFPCGLVYPFEIAEGYKIAYLRDKFMPEISIINKNFDPQVYTEYHRLRDLIARGNTEADTILKFDEIEKEYSATKVHLNPKDAILVIAETALVHEETGLLAGERALTYLPHLQKQVEVGNYNPRDTIPLPEHVQKLLEQREELLAQEGIVTAPEFVTRFLEREGREQEMYILHDGVLEEGFEKFIEENEIVTKEFEGEPLNETYECDGFSRSEIYYIPTENELYESRELKNRR